MRRTEVQAVFVVVFMLAATVKTDSGGATFSGKTVTLTCPTAGKWFDSAAKEVSGSDRQLFDFTYARQIKYSCKHSEPEVEYMFYIKGRACETCIEMDGFIFMIVIAADVIITSLIMMIIYRCAKKKTSADAPTRTPKAPVRPGGMAPPVPSPDYESLNPNTRSADTYSTVVNRMG